MDLLTLAKNVAQRVEAQATQAKVPVAVCVVDVHGNVVLQHRMPGAPLFSLELSERKAYTSALVRLRTADLVRRASALNDSYAKRLYRPLHPHAQWPKTG